MIVEAIVTVAIVLVASLIVWSSLSDGRAEKLTWSEEGHEADRLEDVIKKIEEYWLHQRQLDRDVTSSLATDLRELCTEAQQRSVPVNQIFGDDLKAFADEWAGAHYSTPPAAKLMAFKAVSVASFIFSGYALFNLVGLRNDSLITIVLVSILFSGLAVAGTAVGNPLTSSPQPTSSTRQLKSVGFFVVAGFGAFILAALGTGMALDAADVGEDSYLLTTPSGWHLSLAILLLLTLGFWAGAKEHQLLNTKADPLANKHSSI